MKELRAEIGDGPITMLTHSAGGWLGRLYLRDFGTEGVDRFVSLGSPHRPPPIGAEGVVDQTRGILTYIDQESPGAFHEEFVKGVGFSAEGPLKAKFAGAGYQQVCGSSDVDGDFIVPVPSAHLDGALNINLQGAFHSPLGEMVSFLGPWRDGLLLGFLGALTINLEGAFQSPLGEMVSFLGPCAGPSTLTCALSLMPWPTRDVEDEVAVELPPAISREEFDALVSQLAGLSFIRVIPATSADSRSGGGGQGGGAANTYNRIPYLSDPSPRSCQVSETLKTQSLALPCRDLNNLKTRSLPFPRRGQRGRDLRTLEPREARGSVKGSKSYQYPTLPQPIES
eukprot:gene10647-12327_t